jgi:hypothetical protein
MSTAKKILRSLTEAGENPKKFFRQSADQRAYSGRPIDRKRDFAYHFIFGSPITMSFDVIARDAVEAVRIANLHLHHVLDKLVELGDQRMTTFSLDENNPNYRLTERNILMWWQLDADGDPTMNDDFEH